MGVLIVLAFAGVAAAQESAAPPGATQPEPILETGELMLMVIKPAYDELKKAMAAAPADQQQWAQLYQKAARLAEFENLILFRPHQRAETPEWKSLATSARKSTMTVASAVLKALGNAQAASFVEIKKSYEDVSARCNACHQAMSREAPMIKP